MKSILTSNKHIYGNEFNSEKQSTRTFAGRAMRKIKPSRENSKHSRNFPYDETRMHPPHQSLRRAVMPIAMNCRNA
jgi:hypothetical protein